MGSIYKRGEVYWIKYYRNGKSYRETSKTTKESEAKRLLKKREGEISEGKIPGVCFDRIKFNNLVDDFLADYRVNERKTLARAEQSVTRLKTVFDGTRVTNITTPRINAYVQQRIDEGAENATVNRELSALKRILNLAARQTPPTPISAKRKRSSATAASGCCVWAVNRPIKNVGGCISAGTVPTKSAPGTLISSATC